MGIFDERAERCEKEIRGIPVTKGIDRADRDLADYTHRCHRRRLPMRAHERISIMMQKLNSIPAEILLLMDISWLNVKEVQLRTSMDTRSCRWRAGPWWAATPC